jgi:acetoin utilization protein AcuB
MERNPATVTGDTLVSEAIKTLVEKDLKALPVVENEVLRGLVTRKDLQGCATAVARAQDKHETEYFLKKLKIRDIMIRMPKTVDAGDTVEYCMLRGQRELIRYFPVMENGKLAGMVSSYELFEALSQVLGADEVWCGITLEPVAIEQGTIAEVTSVVSGAGGTLFGVFTMRLPDTQKKRIILRLETPSVSQVTKALEEAGFGIMEVTREVQACHAQNGNGSA